MIRRWLAILVIPALLVVAGLVDSSSRGGRTTVPVTTMSTAGPGGASALAPLTLPDPAAVDSLGPVAAPAGALDATWFCAGGTSNPGGGANAVLTIANAGDHASSATVTAYGPDGRHAASTVAVPARADATVALLSVLPVDSVAAQVDVSGGEVAVSQTVSGAAGTDTQPCATAPSPTWYFANGSTARGAAEKLFLFNPFADDATANVTLQTDVGLRQPPAFQGVVVKAGSLVVLDVGSVENRRPQVAATVTVTSGRLVAARQQVFDGSGDPGPSGSAPVGLEVGPGVPRAVGAVGFPFAYKGAAYGETLFVYNPGSQAAQVAVSIVLDDPAKNGTMPDQQVKIPAGAVATVDLSGLQPLPPEVLQSLVVRTTSGTPIVAELWQERSASTGGGLAISGGTAVRASGWILSGLPLAQSATYVDLYNPGDRAVTVHASLLAPGGGPLAGLDGLTVAPGGRARVAIDEGAVGHPAASILVQAGAPLVVAWERSSTASAHGSTLTAAVPLAGTASLL